MGCWGMGISANDEYCEVYERFIDEYDNNKPLEDIKNDILEEYLEEFDINDEVLHNVYFAIGKAEWMCGGISNDIYNKIFDIVKSGENIIFYKKLGASKSDLRQREKILIKFLDSLSIPRNKIRKRKYPNKEYVKIEKLKLPLFKVGDIFAYKVNNKYRAIYLISRGKFYTTYASYCYAWYTLYDDIPTINELKNDSIIPLGYLTITNFPSMDKLIYIGNNLDYTKYLFQSPGIINPIWKQANWALVTEKNFNENYPIELCMKYNDCLSRLKD